MELNTIIELIQGVGFPIFIAVYLLIVNQNEMAENRKALFELKTVIFDLSQYLKKVK